MNTKKEITDDLLARGCKPIFVPNIKSGNAFLVQQRVLNEVKAALDPSALSWRAALYPSSWSNATILIPRRAANEMVALLHEQKKPDEIALIRLVDLTRNSLFADDLVHVVNLVEELPTCRIVDVSSNRIRVQAPPLAVRGQLTYKDVAAQLLRVLKRESVEFMDISFNAVATVDGKDMFTEIERAGQLTKLIWVPKADLAVGLKGDWRKCLNPSVDDELAARVLQAHSTYYDAKRGRRS